MKFIYSPILLLICFEFFQNNSITANFPAYMPYPLGHNKNICHSDDAFYIPLQAFINGPITIESQIERDGSNISNYRYIPSEVSSIKIDVIKEKLHPPKAKFANNHVIRFNKFKILFSNNPYKDYEVTRQYKLATTSEEIVPWTDIPKNNEVETIAETLDDKILVSTRTLSKVRYYQSSDESIGNSSIAIKENEFKIKLYVRMIDETVSGDGLPYHDERDHTFVSNLFQHQSSYGTSPKYQNSIRKKTALSGDSFKHKIKYTTYDHTNNPVYARFGASALFKDGSKTAHKVDYDIVRKNGKKVTKSRRIRKWRDNDVNTLHNYLTLRPSPTLQSIPIAQRTGPILNIDWYNIREAYKFKISGIFFEIKPVLSIYGEVVELPKVLSFIDLDYEDIWYNRKGEAKEKESNYLMEDETSKNTASITFPHTGTKPATLKSSSNNGKILYRKHLKGGRSVSKSDRVIFFTHNSVKYRLILQFKGKDNLPTVKDTLNGDKATPLAISKELANNKDDGILHTDILTMYASLDYITNDFENFTESTPESFTRLTNFKDLRKLWNLETKLKKAIAKNKTKRQTKLKNKINNLKATVSFTKDDTTAYDNHFIK